MTSSERALSPREVRSPEDVEPFLERLLGAPVLRRPGVRHLAAVDREGSVIRISPRSPESELDFFLLNAARASTEAIISTGRILGEEPELTHALQGAPETVTALRRWRLETLGLSQLPLLVVLSRGRGLDFSHPAWASEIRPVLAVPEKMAEQLGEGVPEAVQVMGLAQTDLRGVIDALETRFGCSQSTIEAGPSTAMALYDEPCRVEELWLSQFCGGPLPAEMRADLLLEGAELERRMPRVAGTEQPQESGRWRFSVHRRAATQE